MKKNFNKVFAIALSAMMMTAVLTGCGEKPVASESSASGDAVVESSAVAEDEKVDAPVTNNGEFAIKEVEVKDASVYTGTPDTSWYTGSETEYTLTTADQLMGFQELRAQESPVNFEGVTVKLGANMTINEATIAQLQAGGEYHIWKNLASDNEFKGTFDGQDYTISGVYMKLGKAAKKGMFGTLGTNAAIKNFTLNSSCFVGPTAPDKSDFAAIAGTVTGENVVISNVHVNALIVAGDGDNLGNVGGFVGGISAPVTLTIENCSFGGAVNTTGECAGGFIGYLSHSKSEVSILNSTFSGNVEAADLAGDFIGWAKKCANLSLEGSTGTGEQFGMKGND